MPDDIASSAEKPDPGKKDPPRQQHREAGGIEGGRRIRKRADEGVTEPLSPEASGGAGAGRKWPGDS